MREASLTLGRRWTAVVSAFDASLLTRPLYYYSFDEFMEGMLQNLFMEKWDRFGYNIWLVHRTLDILYLVPLVTNALWLKEDPMSALKATWLASVGPGHGIYFQLLRAIVLMIGIISIDVYGDIMIKYSLILNFYYE